MSITAGPYSPGTMAKEADWNNANNAKASDGAYTSALLSSGATSGQLIASNYTPDIPDVAVIKGILVEIEHYAGMASSIKDAGIYINAKAENKANADYWPSADDVYVSYGGANDTWGETLTGVDVKASGFSVYVSVTNSAGFGIEAFIDHIRVTFYWSRRVGGPYRRTRGGFRSVREQRGP